MTKKYTDEDLLETLSKPVLRVGEFSSTKRILVLIGLVIVVGIVGLMLGK
ncbi:MAG TPA: hypothetical protein VGM95_02355 [Lactobacillaceae bacterium]|jgi:hypothetical protein